VGLLAYIMGRLRRRWYEPVWNHLNATVAREVAL